VAMLGLGRWCRVCSCNFLNSKVCLTLRNVFFRGGLQNLEDLVGQEKEQTQLHSDGLIDLTISKSKFKTKACLYSSNNK